MTTSLRNIIMRELSATDSPVISRGQAERLAERISRAVSRFYQAARLGDDAMNRPWIAFAASTGWTLSLGMIFYISRPVVCVVPLVLFTFTLCRWCYECGIIVGRRRTLFAFRGMQEFPR